jgi:hypothetical protein
LEYSQAQQAASNQHRGALKKKSGVKNVTICAQFKQILIPKDGLLDRANF